MMSAVPSRVDVRSLTARSAILSLLLGSHPPEAAGSVVVRWGRGVGIAEPAVRVALSRMVAAGDLERHDGVYRLSERLLQRQRRQDEALDLEPLPWDGQWTVVAVTRVGADAASRADLRGRMTTDRFAELREGVWLRPANLAWAPSREVAPNVEVMTARPATPGLELAATLFDLDAWTGTAHALSATLADSHELARRIAVAAAIVRHLVADPLLPAELLPPSWPGPALRATYAAFRAELIAAAAG